jgi:hypothetical protein
MTCSRCQGCCVQEEAETAEGALRLDRCVNCGERFEELVNRHQRRRPEPSGVVFLPIYHRHRMAKQEAGLV